MTSPTPMEIPYDQYVGSYRVDCWIPDGCNVCQEMAKTKKELDTALETLRRLIQKCTALKAPLNAVHDRFSNKLPLEIISGIFLLASKPNVDERFVGSAKNYLRPPTILSSVCRRWRNIAHSLPELWNNIHIDVIRGPAEFAEEWLARARTLSLNITLHLSNTYNTSEDAMLAFESNTAALLSHSSRWEYLNLESMSRDLPLDRLLTGLETIKSNTFQIRFGECLPNGSIHLEFPFRPGRFSSQDPEILSKIAPIKWTNLTHLELYSYPAGDILHIIKQAPILVSCKLIFIDRSSNTIAIPVENRSLQELELTSLGEHGVEIFRNLTVPSLQCLEYNSMTRGISNQEFCDLKNFLVRSALDGPLALQTFTLGYRYLSAPDYEQSGLLELTNVTHLKIDSVAVFESLLLKMSQDALAFPNLQHLDLSIPSGHEYSIAYFWRDSLCALLCDFVTEHNLNAHKMEQRQASEHTPVDVNAGRAEYRRSFKSISISVYRRKIEMSRRTFSHLQEAQNARPLSVNVFNRSNFAGTTVNMLDDPRCLTELPRTTGNFVVLQSFG